MSTSRTFIDEDQQSFAQLSGDWNPIHTDAVAARRTIFGAQVVHGVHALLWAIDVSGLTGTLKRIEAKFLRGITLGSPVDCRVEAGVGRGFSLTILKGGVRAAQINGEFAAESPTYEVSDPTDQRRLPVDLTFEQVGGTKGSVPVALDRIGARALFPNGALPEWQIAVLLATTRIVGMECPGLHSLYSGLTVDFSGPKRDAELKFEVVVADARFSAIELAVRGAGASGTLRAFMRPRPQPQPAFANAQALVEAGEFASWRALIVGGSRGLGEISAKIISAGGGAVCVTYHRGAAEAAATCAALRAAGREAHTAPLDVTTESAPTLPWAPTHLLYFATPHIALDKGTIFSPRKFALLSEYYVAGFQRVFSSLRPPLDVLYPSTVFLDETTPNAAEYCAAKAAGEELCRHFAKRIPNCRIHVPRLPRMLTDQTVGLLRSESAEALPLILRELRALAALR
jgi:MaoC like domain